MKTHAGDTYPLTKTSILRINSPEKEVDGPYAVIYIDTVDRWAIVALDYSHNPRLGIRWFHSSMGIPQSSATSTWFIIPTLLNNAVLRDLGLSKTTFDMIDNFLNGHINGEALKTIVPITK